MNACHAAAHSGAERFGPVRREYLGGHSRSIHELALNRVRLQLQRWFPSAQILIDRAGRAREGGRIVIDQRPDAQYSSPQRGGQRVYVEVDTTDDGMRDHMRAAQRGTHHVFLRIDPTNGVRLRQRDFFDELDADF